MAPFILRGIALLGIDSVMAPHAVRQAAWERLARDLDLTALEHISKVVGLAAAISAAQDIVAGKIRGRIVVDVNG
jgi:acrylyl-CoA reductase (NADPH)